MGMGNCTNLRCVGFVRFVQAKAWDNDGVGVFGKNKLHSRVNGDYITTMCRDFGIEDADLQRYIKDGTSEDQVRAAILEKLRQDKPPLTTGIHVTESGEDEFRRDASEGLLLRGGVELEKPSEGAAHFSHMTLRDLAIECLERAGVADARRMSNDGLLQELFSRQYFNPTAAFPSILDNAIEKAYVQGHRTAAVTFDQWTRKGSLKDFKVHDNNYLAGPIGDFLEVPEGGELKNDKPTDAKLPTRKIKTYGKQFTLSRQAFINDDIDLVTRIPARYAAAARRTINTQCYVSLELIDKICLFLDCPVSDVIEVLPGTQKGPAPEAQQESPEG